MSVTLQILGSRFSLARELRRALAQLRVARGRWAVKVVRDGEMAELHERTMGIAGTTDVLTFDMRDERAKKQGARSKKQELGAIDLDTVVCVDEARRRAGEMGHTVREELLLYCVHSLLHVQGYDDVTAAGARRMHAREDEILEAVGVGAVYLKTKDERRKMKDKGAKTKTAERKMTSGRRA